MMSSTGRTLIVDPHTMERTVIATFLRGENYKVETAQGLVEALKKISRKRFNCLIMDVDLPEMKGYEAVSILRKMDPNLKIIITTRKNSKSLETKVRKQDIFFYFIKSFSKSELKQALDSAMNK